MKNLLISIVIFLIVFGWFFFGWPQIWKTPQIPPEIKDARASNYLTNPSFTGGTAGWMLAGSVYDSVYFQDAAGSTKTATAVGRNIVGIGSTQQTIAAIINAGDKAELNLYWSKQCVVANCTRNTIRVDIAKPSAPNTWVTVWSNTSIPVYGSSTAWVAISNLDISSNFNETGQYKIRLYADLRNGNNTRAQSFAWFDNINLDVTPPVIFPASWKEAENASTTIGIGENVRLRMALANATGSTATDYDYRLEYAAKVGNICGEDEIFIAVPVSAAGEHFEMATSTYFTNGNPTTVRLSNPEGYTFVTGKMVSDPSNSSGNLTLPTARYTEIEFVFKATATASGLYCFRITKAGIILDEYVIYPELEIRL